MAKFALIKRSSQTIKKVVDGDKRFRTSKPPTLPEEKGIYWLPYVLVDPPLDVDTQVKEGPVDTITDIEATRVFTVRDLTQQELREKHNRLADVKMSGVKTLILALNNGSFVPGQNLTKTQMVSIIRDNM